MLKRSARQEVAMRRLRAATVLLSLGLLLLPARGSAQPEPAEPEPGEPEPAGRTFEEIQPQLQAADADLRAQAAYELGQIGDTRAIEPLIQALQNDAAGSVRAAAATALGQLQAGSAAGFLQRAAQADPDPAVRSAANAALAQVGGPPPPQPGYTPPPRDRRAHKKAVERYLMENDPEYRSARGQRTAGIVVASVVGAGGLLVGMVAGLGYAICDGLEGDCRDWRNWTIGGFVTMAVGLGVGLPLALIGHGKVKEIRARATTGYLPELNVSLTAQGGGLGATWRF
jgi:hypothetical protein